MQKTISVMCIIHQGHILAWNQRDGLRNYILHKVDIIFMIFK